MTDLLAPSTPFDEGLAASEPPPRRGPRWLERLGSASPETILTFLVVFGCVVFTLANLNPQKLLWNTTPTGGDMGAHVWGPAYLRDHLLPHGRLSGWAPDWYAGFPMYQFYMVLPALLVVGVDVLLPYAVALKLVSVLGITTMPITAWALGKGNRLPFPLPALFSVGTVFFLYDETFTIYGGNIASTMAGEFSHSLATSLSLAYLALLSHSLRTGKRRGWVALLLAATALCHLIVAFWAAAATALLFVVHSRRSRAAWVGGGAVAIAVLLALVGPIGLSAEASVIAFVVVALVIGLPDLKRIWLVVSAAAAGGLVTMFWVLPFYWRRHYLTDMGYEKRVDFLKLLFPHSEAGFNAVGRFPWYRLDEFVRGLAWFDRILLVLAIVGFAGSLVKRLRAGVFLGLSMVLFLTWPVLQPQGHLWNARLTPFLHLSRYLLAVTGVAMLGWLVAWALRSWRPPVVRWAPVGTLAVACLVGVSLLGMGLRRMPFGNTVYVDRNGTGEWVYRWGPFESTKATFIDDWANWNFEGYENKPAYGEYHGIVTTMARIGQERGCGRALWENNNDTGAYGTPMALMLLPFWTDGCIASMEGLFFEASATTPFHFITAAALSANSSNPVRKINYENGRVDKGVQYLQLLGVRYYLAYNATVVDQAKRNPALVEIATTGPWTVFEVRDAPLVEGLTAEPAVVEDVLRDREGWLEIAKPWFQTPERWSVMLAQSGPPSWQRLPERAVADGTAQPETRPLPPVKVSDVVTSDDRISFTVDRPGVPVLVKASYFPNWQVSGGQGPYRVMPNLMVVIPDSTEVSLHYGRTPVDWLAMLLSVVGIGMVVLLFRRPQVDLVPVTDDLAPMVAPPPPPPPPPLDVLLADGDWSEVVFGAGDGDGGTAGTAGTAEASEGPLPSPRIVPVADPTAGTDATPDAEIPAGGELGDAPEGHDGQGDGDPPRG